MKILIQRKWKKAGYTIGNLFVDGKWFCNTLEPVDRGLRNDSIPGKPMSPAWEEASSSAILTKARYAKGTTAIPTGSYRVQAFISTKFHQRRLFLKDVPGFLGIMIHEGNTVKDTQGCILVGKNTKKGMVTESKDTLAQLNEKVFEALGRREVVMAQVV